MPRSRSSSMRLCTIAVAAGCFGVATTLLVAWAVPTVMLWFGWLSAPKSADTWWTDGNRGGHYVREHHALWDRLDFRRIIFVGTVEELPYYRQNEPPAWAAVVSLDQREGFEEVVTTATGWPWRCFRGENWVDWSPPEPADPNLTPLNFTMQDGKLVQGPAPAAWSAERPRGLWRIERGGQVVASVPVMPMWVGLVGNLAVFAGLFLLPVVGFGVVRRWSRRRGGRCAGCGYDRNGLASEAPCPECGAGSAAA